MHKHAPQKDLCRCCGRVSVQGQIRSRVEDKTHRGKRCWFLFCVTDLEVKGWKNSLAPQRAALLMSAFTRFLRSYRQIAEKSLENRTDGGSEITQPSPKHSKLTKNDPFLSLNAAKTFPPMGFPQAPSPSVPRAGASPNKKCHYWWYQPQHKDIRGVIHAPNSINFSGKMAIIRSKRKTVGEGVDASQLLVRGRTDRKVSFS